MPANPHRLWSGSLTFGLVSMPVALVTALTPTRNAFHLIHRTDKSRLNRRMFCPRENVFVHPEHIQRGYEVEPGRYVTVTSDEIEAIAPDRSTTIEILEFVDVDRIEPAHFVRPYYLVPTGAEKPYRLLVDILGEMKKAGISEFVMHEREHFCAVRSVDGALCLMVLRYSNEIRSPEGIVPDAEAKEDFVNSMRVAIKKSMKQFRPEEIVDEYQERVDKLIQKKKRKHEVVQVYEAEEEGEELEEIEAGEMDLVAALEKSLSREKGRK